MNKITVAVDIDTEDIIDELIFCTNYDEMFQIIKQLDERIGDWDFSEMCYEHFKQLHEVYIKEVK